MPALLGAYPGLTPAWGWLFAVALGLQHRSATAVLRALPAIALGHAVSVSAVVVPFGLLGLVLPAGKLRVIGALLMLGFGVALLLRRRTHPRWVGMRLGFRDLAVWSFLMSTAHGAGLMLLPLLFAGAGVGSAHGAHGGRVAYDLAGGGASALGVHTAAMFTAMSLAALVVFRVMGVGFLRRAWLNLDAVWIGALLVAGVATLLG
jgi:hypothetical protein